MSLDEPPPGAGTPRPRRTPWLGDEAYERLKGAILDVELKPGGIFSISELARFVGMSRTPVKEALSRLERDHLVELIPNQGLKVRELTLDEVIHILNVREAMDGLAARLATRTIDPATLERFGKEFRQYLIEDVPANPDHQAALSRDLHRTIVSAAGNPYLESSWNSLMISFARVSNAGWRAWKRSPTPSELTLRRCREHLDIINALLEGDEDKAEWAARRHVANALRDIIAAAVHLNPDFSGRGEANARHSRADAASKAGTARAAEG